MYRWTPEFQRRLRDWTSLSDSPSILVTEKIRKITIFQKIGLKLKGHYTPI